MRATRRLGISLASILIVFTLGVFLVLHSKSVQRFIYHTYASSALENIGVSTSFSGMEYSDGDFFLPKLDIYLHQTKVATLKRVTVSNAGLDAGVIHVESVYCDTLSINARDTALLRNWLRALPSDTSTIDFPISIANNSIKYLEIELVDDKRITGEVNTRLLSFKDGAQCSDLISFLRLDTIETDIHITELNLGKRNSLQFDASSNFGLIIHSDARWNEDEIFCSARVNTSQDFKNSIIPEKWSVFSDDATIDVLIKGTSVDSLTINTQFSHNLFTGAATTKIKDSDYKISGNLTLEQLAYDSTILKEWLPDPIMQVSAINYSIHGSLKKGTIAYQIDARKGINSAKIWADEWEGVARLELDLPEFPNGPLYGGTVKAAIKPSLPTFLMDDNTEIVGVAPTLIFDDYTVRGFSFEWQHHSDKDSIWWSCLDSLMDIDGSLVIVQSVFKAQSNINSLGLELLDPLDTGQILSAHVVGSLEDNFTGFFNAQDILLQRPTDVVFINAFDVVHEKQGTGRRIGVSSDVMQGYIEGSFDWNGLSAIPGVLFSDLAGGPKVASNVNAKVAFEASTIDWLSQLLHLGVVLPEGGYMVANFVGPSSSWNYSLNVPHLRYNGIEAFAIEGEGSKERRGIQAFLKAGAINGISTPLDSLALRWDSPTDFQQFIALAQVRDSIPTRLLAGAEYKEGAFIPNLLELQMGAHQASLVGTSPVFWNSTSFDSDSLILQGSLGTIRMSGGLGALATNPLCISLSNINAHWLNYWYREPRMQFDGRLDAILRVEESFPNLEGSGTLQWSNVQLNRELLGNFNSTLQWSTAANDVFLNGTLLQPGATRARLSGHYNPSIDDLDMVVVVDQLDIHPFEPLLGGVLTQISGILNGSARVSGPVKDWEADGEFSLVKPTFNIPITGTSLSASTLDFGLNEQRIALDSGYWTDGTNTTAALTWGGIEHDRFSTLDFDIHLKADSALGMQLNRAYDSYFYGTGIVDGDLIVDGPLEQIHLGLNATTKEGSILKIPLDNPTEVETPSFLRFITNESRAPVDTSKAKSLEYFTTDMEIEVLPDAMVELILDEVMGDIISSRGTGNMRVKILEDESFELYGLYTIASGDYLFTLQGIINKPFELIPGGTILWSGDLYEAEVNLQAKYSVNTDLKGLVTNANYSNENVDVDLIITLTGSLMQPEIGFDIVLPNSPSSYQQELERRILTADAMNYQAFSLLMLGDFYRQNLGVQEGINLSESFTRSTSEVLVSQFGTWIAAGLGSYVDVELDYTTGNNPYNSLVQSGDEIRLGVSKDFMDGRLRINSSLDVPIASDGSSTLLLGDTQIEYELTKDGRTVLRAFNRSNRNDPLLQNTGPYTQGVGIQFRKDFDGK